MKIQLLPDKFTVCQLDAVDLVDLEDDFVFLKIRGAMDFSLIGIISRLTSVLAAEDIPVFVISTFNTDYFFVKDEDLSKALYVLEDEYQTVIDQEDI